jgi:hypothetical protein
VQAVLVELGTRQHGVFTTSQARNRGVSRKTIDRLVASGELTRLHRGVLASASVPVRWEQRIMASCLACGPNVAASHFSAAAIWGLAEGVDKPHVTVPGTTSKTRPGIVVHRIQRFEVRTRNDFPVTPPMRTLLDLAAVYPEELLERAIDNAHRQGLIEMSRLKAYLGRPEHARSPGSGAMREMVEVRVGRRPIGSDLESILFPAMRKIRIPLPTAQYPVETPNGMRFIDYAYPEAKLAIELEGFETHGLSRATFEDDRVRFNDLRDLGWDLRQFTWKATRADPVAAAIKVGRALGLMPCRWKKG